MAIRECDCKDFQDSGHTDECNAHYKPDSVKLFERMMTEVTGCKFVDVTPTRGSDNVTLEEEVAILFLKERLGMNDEQARAEVERLKRKSTRESDNDK